MVFNQAGSSFFLCIAALIEFYGWKKTIFVCESAIYIPIKLWANNVFPMSKFFVDSIKFAVHTIRHFDAIREICVDNKSMLKSCNMQTTYVVCLMFK